MKNFQLRIPGPTPLPRQVLKAMAAQMINHRSPEFAEIFLEVTNKLKRVFQTKNDILVFPGSGTGGLEAAIVNLFSPGEKIIVVSIGAFGKRFGDIARAFGLNVVQVDFPLGQSAQSEVIEKILAREKNLSGVLITHNETSTGVTNDIDAIAKIVKKKGLILVVDAVSSLAAIDLPVDKLDIDVVVTASQKALMAPPGLTILSVSDSAWQKSKTAQLPRFYWDFAEAKKWLEKGQTPYTPAISTFFGLHEALKMIEREGLENVFKRHKQIASLTRLLTKKLGLTLFAEESHASETVTTVNLPPKVDGKEFLTRLQEKYGVVLAGGQGELKGKIFRIGHMGYVTEKDIRKVCHAIGETFAQMGSK